MGKKLSSSSPATATSGALALIPGNAPEQFAEINGFLCGFICSGIEAEGKMWLESVLGSLTMSDCDIPQKRHAIIELYKHLAKQMQTETFGLNKDFLQASLSLNTRAYALKQWCNGFLSGLQQAGLPVHDASSSPGLVDTLDNLNNLAKLNLEKVEISEEDEAIFTQVTGYIELAVTQIYRILNHVKAKH